MTDFAAADMSSFKSSPDVGDLLRTWRRERRLSQLDLSLEADVSTRHISYIESGKARPSRAMIDRLADVFKLPLRQRNSLLAAGGFAPAFRESSLLAPEMDSARQAIDLVLGHHDPFPALVTNRYLDVLETNRGFERVFGAIRGDRVSRPNVFYQAFDPNDLRPLIVNWDETARDLIRHLHAEAAAAPSDLRLQTLLAEVLEFPGVPAGWRRQEAAPSPHPVMTVAFRVADRDVRFFSTMTTFAAAQDITLEEIRIESMFPADRITADFCRGLAEADAAA